MFKYKVLRDYKEENSRRIYEVLWWTLTFTAIVIVTMTGNDPDWVKGVTLFASAAGLTSVLLVAKRNRWNLPFGVTEVVLWAVLFIYWGAYLSALKNLAILLPFIILAFANWTKNPAEDNNHAEPKRLSVGDWTIILIVFGSLFAGLAAFNGLIIHDSGINATIALEALIFTMTVLAMVLMVFRYQDQWFVWLGVNLVTITWAISLKVMGLEEDSITSLIILITAYSINNIYGIINWKKRG